MSARHSIIKLMIDFNQENQTAWRDSNYLVRQKEYPFLRGPKPSKYFILFYGGDEAKEGTDFNERRRQIAMSENDVRSQHVDHPEGSIKGNKYGKQGTTLTFMGLIENEFGTAKCGELDIAQNLMTTANKHRSMYETTKVTNRSITVFLEQNVFRVVGEKIYRSCPTNNYLYCQTTEMFLDFMFMPFDHGGVTANAVLTLHIDHLEEFFRELGKNKHSQTVYNLMLIQVDYGLEDNYFSFVNHLNFSSNINVGVQGSSILCLQSMISKVFPTQLINQKDTAVNKKAVGCNITICCGFSNPQHFGNGEAISNLSILITKTINAYKPTSISIEHFNYDHDRIIGTTENILKSIIKYLDEIRKASTSINFTWLDSHFSPTLEKICMSQYVKEITIKIPDSVSERTSDGFLYKIMQRKQDLERFVFFSPKITTTRLNGEYDTGLIFITEDELDLFKQFLQRNQRTLKSIQLYNFDLCYLTALAAFAVNPTSLQQVSFTSRNNDVFFGSSVLFGAYQCIDTPKTYLGQMTRNIARCVCTLSQRMNKLVMQKEKDVVEDADREHLQNSEILFSRWKLTNFAYQLALVLERSDFRAGFVSFSAYVNRDSSTKTQRNDDENDDAEIEIPLDDLYEQAKKHISNYEYNKTHVEYLLQFMNVLMYMLPKEAEL